MAPRILPHLPLEILVEGFLAADKAAAIVLRAEEFDTGRPRLRRGHLQCHCFLIAARGGPQSMVDRRRVKQAFGEGTAVPNAELDHFMIDNRPGRCLLGQLQR